MHVGGRNDGNFKFIIKNYIQKRIAKENMNTNNNSIRLYLLNLHAKQVQILCASSKQTTKYSNHQCAHPLRAVRWVTTLALIDHYRSNGSTNKKAWHNKKVPHPNDKYIALRKNKKCQSKCRKLATKQRATIKILSTKS